MKLLETKLSCPQSHHQTLERTRLLDTLDEQIDHKLILVCGPAGSGKSTLLSQWVHRSKIPHVWLSLEGSDNDPIRFVTYLREVFRRIAPQLAKEPDALPLDRDELDAVVAYVERFVLYPLLEQSVDSIVVLDDLHLVTNKSIFKALEILINHMPSSIVFAIASREELPLMLSRMRVRGELYEIQGDDLRLSEEEASLFYNRIMGLGLNKDQTAALQRYTEGWMAASMLTALRLKKEHPKNNCIEALGRDGYLIEDDLLAEVLACQSESVQEFLLATSVLKRMNDSLCAALLQDKRNKVTLGDLERKNLFVVPLDEKRSWYRYHHLFAKFLQSRLFQHHPRRKHLHHLRASKWFAEHALIQESAEHAAASGDQEWLAEIIERWWIELFMRGEVLRLKEWLDLIDDDVLKRRPLLAIARAGCASMRESSTMAMEQRLDRVYETVVSRQDTIAGQNVSYLDYFMWFIKIITLFHRGDHRGIVRVARQAEELPLEQLPQLKSSIDCMTGVAEFYLCNYDRAARLLDRTYTESLESRSYYVAYTAIAIKCMLLRALGKIRESESLSRDVLDKANSRGLGSLPALGAVHIELGMLLVSLGKYEKALVSLEKGTRLHSVVGANHQLSLGYGYLALLELARGDLSGAKTAIEKCLACARQLDNADILNWALSVEATFELTRGNITSALQWANSYKRESVSAVVIRCGIDIAVARVKIARGSFESAVAHIDESLYDARRNRIVQSVVPLLVLKTVALVRSGDKTQASAVLQEALLEAMPEEFRVSFNMAKHDLAPLVRTIEDRGAREYLSSIVETKRTKADETKAPMPVAQPQGLPQIIEPLSNRELEVLELIAQGKPNKEVAESISISLSTVKTHLHNAFGKLGVNNRTQAVHIARSMGLI